MKPQASSHILGRLVASVLLLLLVVGAGLFLANWKRGALAASAAAATSQPEYVEWVAAAPVTLRDYVKSSTSIGTVRALRSVTLQNELAGTVHKSRLESGAVVEAGELLLSLDVSVEEAELAAAKARARLAETLRGRTQRAATSQGASAADVDRAQAEFDVAQAEVARIGALIERKRLRAPFRARVGLVDVHLGQYLEAGTVLTSLQGVDEAVHVDFHVAQDVAAALAVGDIVEVLAQNATQAFPARIEAIDAETDTRTRNTLVRARLESAAHPAPGGSVRVRVPLGERRPLPVVPVSALRKGPSGEHVFVVVVDDAGLERVRMRRVTSGPMLGDEVVILEGLAEGERVAASGSFKLAEGMRVSIAGANQAAAAPSAPEGDAVTPLAHN